MHKRLFLAEAKFVSALCVENKHGSLTGVHGSVVTVESEAGELTTVHLVGIQTSAGSAVSYVPHCQDEFYLHVWNSVESDLYGIRMLLASDALTSIGS